MPAQSVFPIVPDAATHSLIEIPDGATLQMDGANLDVSGDIVTEQIRTDNYFFADGTRLPGGGAPQGPNSSVQFNNNKVFGGLANVTFDGSNLVVNSNFYNTTNSWYYANGTPVVFTGMYGNGIAGGNLGEIQFNATGGAANVFGAENGLQVTMDGGNLFIEKLANGTYNGNVISPNISLKKDTIGYSPEGTIIQLGYLMFKSTNVSTNPNSSTALNLDIMLAPEAPFDSAFIPGSALFIIQNGTDTAVDFQSYNFQRVTKTSWDYFQNSPNLATVGDQLTYTFTVGTSYIFMYRATLTLTTLSQNNGGVAYGDLVVELLN